MAWEFIKTVKLDSNATSLECDFTSEGTKDFLYVEMNCYSTTYFEAQLQFDGVTTGGKYATARRNDFSTSGFTSQNMTKINASGDGDNAHFFIWINNQDGISPKTMYSYSANDDGQSGSAYPRLAESFTTFYQSDQIKIIKLVENAGVSGTFSSGTQINVFGINGS